MKKYHRIIFSKRPGGLEEINKILLLSINEVINNVIDHSEIVKDNISVVALAGNTTMTQLWLKINPQYIRLSPYIPATNFYSPIYAADLGLSLKFVMRANLGAIEDFHIDPTTLEPKIVTIGNFKPKGICGSGLISIVADMFEKGIIDSRGKFNCDILSPHIIEKNNVYEYVLAWAKDTQISRSITITENDIDNILIAGSFGSCVNLEKVMTIGLLPEIKLEKITFVRNSSLTGAKTSLLSNDIRKRIYNVVEKVTNCELSETQSYMNHYIASLFLPHTNINLFPKLKARFQTNSKIYNLRVL